MIVKMIDTYCRKINYIRISVTDRCNLGCIYCRPVKGLHHLSRSQILTYEEIIRLIHLAISCGITKVRLTGGDPLIRKDIVHLVQQISQLEGIQDVSLTTNGVLLEQMAERLYEDGLRRVNISLDSLKREKYKDITGYDKFDQVWKGILKAEKVGFHPIKINVVMIRGVNDDEILDLAKLSLLYPFHIRFIEFMPIGNQQLWEKKGYFPCEKIKDILHSFQPLSSEVSAGVHLNNGPAKLYAFPSSLGKIGFISSMSNHFCSTCNRIRITADGKVRNCLFSDQEIDVLGALRSGKSDKEVRKLMTQGIKSKPKGHSLNQKCRSFTRFMNRIGG